MRVIAKKLITKNNFQEFISELDDKIYITKDMMLTPGAKDILRNKGIIICFGERSDNKKSDIKSKEDCDEISISNNVHNSDIINVITKILTNEYGITDTSILKSTIDNVLANIN